MEWVSRIRGAVSTPKATFVLMHGLGSDENDMFGLAQALHPELEIICLRAPHSYGPGFAWFDVQWTPAGIRADEAQLWQSVHGVANFLESLKSPVIVGGFSQGAMMTLGLMHEFPSHFQGAVLLSGRKVKDETPNFERPVFQAHGTFDDVIRMQEGDAVKRILSPLGDRFTSHEYQMGHWICEEEIADLNDWFTAQISVL
jgi:phospholipase/carboxylesterase